MLAELELAASGSFTETDSVVGLSDVAASEDSVVVEVVLVVGGAFVVVVNMDVLVSAATVSLDITGLTVVLVVLVLALVVVEVVVVGSSAAVEPMKEASRCVVVSNRRSSGLSVAASFSPLRSFVALRMFATTVGCGVVVATSVVLAVVGAFVVDVRVSMLSIGVSSIVEDAPFILDGIRLIATDGTRIIGGSFAALDSGTSSNFA